MFERLKRLLKTFSFYLSDSLKSNNQIVKTSKDLRIHIGHSKLLTLTPFVASSLIVSRTKSMEVKKSKQAIQVLS